MRPKRPIASLRGNGLDGAGPVTFKVEDAYPNSWYLVLSAPVQYYQSAEETRDMGNFLFHTGLNFILHTTTPRYVATNAQGKGSFTYTNYGHDQGTRAMQALIADPSGRFIASSNAVLN